MSFSALTAEIDQATRDHLCDPVELRPVGGGAALVVPAMIDAPMQAASGFGAPILQATIQVLVSDRVLKVGDVAMPGLIVDGVFVPAEMGWRIAGAPTRDDDGVWQTAAIERYRP